MAVHFVGHQIPGAEGAQRFTEALARVQQVQLRPQVLKAIRARRTGKTDEPTDAATDATQRTPALRLGGLEARELVHHHDRERPSVTEILGQPDDVLAIDYVNIGRSRESRHALLLCTDNGRNAKVGQVSPALALRRPGVQSNALRSDDQHRPVLQAVVQQQVECGQGSYSFSSAGR